MKLVTSQAAVDTTKANDAIMVRVPVAIPFIRLKRSKSNMRSLSPNNSDDQELLASIKANGIIQNLTAYQVGDGYEVPAGGRRLGALEEMFKAKLIPEDHPVYCIVIDAADAENISLHENYQRKAPHPADIYTSFAKQIKDGKEVKDIAISHGITEIAVQKYMRLGNLNKTLFNLFRRNELSKDQIMAYAGTNNKKLQLATFKNLGESTNTPPHIIRSRLQEGCGSSDTGIAKFVTVEAYQKAGGTVESDMFNNSTTLKDLTLLTELAEAKLAKIAESITGWKWVECKLSSGFSHFSYSDMPSSLGDVPIELTKKKEALEARLDELESIEEDDWSDELGEEYHTVEQAIDGARDVIERDHSKYAKDDMAYGGCVVTFDDETGELEIYRGLMSSEDLKAYRSKDSKCEAGDIKSTPAVVEEAGISTRLKEDLGLYRRSIISSELAMSPKLAIDLLHFQLCTRMLSSGMDRYLRVLDVQCAMTSNESSMDDYSDTSAGKAIEAARAKLDTSWLAPKSEANRFEAFRKLAPGKKSALIAFVVAMTLDSGTHQPGRDKLSDHLVKTLEIEFEKHWRPTADNYFQRLTTVLLQKLGKKMFGVKWAVEHEKDTKKTLVAYFDQLFSSSSDNESDKTKLIRAKWLPEVFTKK